MKSQKFMKLTALALVLVFTVSAFAACGKNSDTKPSGSGTTNVPSYTTPLVVAYDTFSQKFNPFFAATAYDQDVVGMTQLGAMTTTRSSAIVYKAIEGEKEVYNGTEYEYKGVSDLTVDTSNPAQTVYTLKIRDDLKFSDGHSIDIDDVIFYYYVVSDPNYTGNSTFGTLPIIGLQEYQKNNSNIANFDVDKFIEEFTNTEFIALVDDYMRDIIAGELDWVKTVNMAEQVHNPEVFTTEGSKLYLFYGRNMGKYFTSEKLTDSDGKEYTNYTPTAELLAMDDAAVVTMIQDEYINDNHNYKALAVPYANDATYFDGDIEKLAYQVGSKITEGEEVPNIAGIKRIDDYTVSVTTIGYAANAVYQIGAATITPMHYYGDESLYDYANNKFGFNNRAANAMELIESKMSKPMGAGPYQFVEFSNRTVTFKANPYYWEGEPYIKNVQFRETSEGDKVTGIKTGDVDIANEVSGTKERFAQIEGINKDREVVATSLVWNLGYGYIGMNSEKVRVGTDSGSDASKNLRKAIATVIAVNRDVPINSFYGDAAVAIQYPISSTSWAAPQASDAGYQIAFSVDVNGQPIYTEGMDNTAKRAAALQAALGYLQAAGYTVENGKVTAAPEGAKLSYELIIPANGKGDHPAYHVGVEASKDLATIGIELKINDPANTQILWDKLDAGEQDLWAAAWGSTIDPDMYQVYHSTSIGKSNHYHINSPELDELIITGRTSADQTFRKTVYTQALNVLMDWAVEIPTYQRKNVVAFSTARVKMDTVTPDITTYWGWQSEIATLEINK